MIENGNSRSYSYRDQTATQEFDTHIANKCAWRVTRFIFTIVLVLLVTGASFGGSILTQYVLDKLQIPGLYDWQNELIQVLLIGVPLGIVVGILSFDFRAGLAVSLLTISSLYVAWETYLPNNESTGNGIFDFLLGNRFIYIYNYTTTESDGIRELAGMSLWGLVLTFPTGYILYSLGFGSTYAMSGSVIGSTYFIAEYVNTDLGALSCVGDKCAYYLWGFWIWLVLLFLSINRLCKTIRYVVSKSKQPTLLRCYHWCCYNRVYTALFEIFTFLFTLLLLASLVYFSLAEEDRVTKGQTISGLLVNILALVITQSYRTGKCVQDCLQKRKPKLRIRAPITRSIRVVTPPSRNDFRPPGYDQVVTGEHLIYPQISEAANCPQEIAIPPQEPVANQQLCQPIVENEQNVEEFPNCNERTTLVRERIGQQEKKPMLYDCYMCVYFFQKFFYTEILRTIQLLIDLVGGLAMGGVIALTIVAIVLGWNNPR
ncbi:hypothetical protein LOD99_2769 [Oopsacas minuta]|uniref:Uncharacterized protein n=1 Tax=Oopsacas minuta TaxID=111878 RepID=A0AAV7K291_9METZ|nr:hypothetical protein LOD99_2769 [Oopsacas minuta]